ncbi:Uncharacterised protein [Klebsiella pneumoniae]|nr:Uncharacterised protein [Klebsiella pneumoniae]
MHLSSKLRKIENENQLSFRFFFEDEGIKEKVIYTCGIKLNR